MFRRRDRSQPMMRQAYTMNRWFYVALASLISLTGLSGFWFTYFGPILAGDYAPAGGFLHLHGWSFFAWYLFFPLQALLVALRRRSLHKMLGRLSVLLVALMTFTGILVLSVRVEEATREGEPLVWLMYGPLILSNLVLFLAFYGAGLRMALTNRLQAHKRLMIVASAIAIGAGFFRLILFMSGFHPLSLPVGVLACSLFVVIGAGYDWMMQRSVHPVYWIGLASFVIVMVPLLPQVSESNVAWVNHWLAALGANIGFLYEPEPTVEF